MATTYPPTGGIASRLAEDEKLCQDGLLQPACKARFFAPDDSRALAGVVLMLHGFTAGPWQFIPMAKFFEAWGLASYAARLPGHGAQSRAPRTSDALMSEAPVSTEDGSLLPRSFEAQHYSACAAQALGDAREMARAHNVPLFVVGMSAGGAMAIDLMARFASDITRSLLIAPLIRPAGVVRRMFFGTLRFVPGGAKRSDTWAFGWSAAAARPDGWRRAGHSRFSLGNVYALFRYAGTTGATRRRPITVPTQIFCAPVDDKIDVGACRAFVRRSRGRHHLHCFARSWNVPHAMLTPEENPHEESRRQICELGVRFLLTGAGSDQL